VLEAGSYDPSAMTDRPATDPAKLLSQWDDWAGGEELPGRTMANLKTGGARDLLEAGGDTAAALLEVWQGWEKGRTVPADVLIALRDGGFREMLAALAG
jgi:hypothetical protein